MPKVGKRRCKDCIFAEDCNRRVACKHYAPTNEDVIDKLIELNQREEKEEYARAWESYLNEFYNCD